MSTAEGKPPILIFDGHCGLCLRSVQLLLRHDRSQQFRFSTLASRVGRALLVQAGHAHLTADTAVLIDGRGQAHGLSDAPLRALLSLGGWWRWIGILLVIPPPVRHGLYRYVAARRLGWFGQGDLCALGDPTFGGRLLDSPEN